VDGVTEVVSDTASSLTDVVDDTVDGVTDALDQGTGGSSAPVSAGVDQTVQGAGDTVEGAVHRLGL
jgi:hypothetical protein